MDSFGNMCWRVYLFFLYNVQKCVVVLTHILPYVQAEQGCTSIVVTHSTSIWKSVCAIFCDTSIPNHFFRKFVPISPSPGSTHSKCCSVLSRFKFSREFQSRLGIKFVINNVSLLKGRLHIQFIHLIQDIPRHILDRNLITSIPFLVLIIFFLKCLWKVSPESKSIQNVSVLLITI